jgi:hypothetical protein
LTCLRRPIFRTKPGSGRGKVDVEFVDLGEQNLKNIARPVRACTLVGCDHRRATPGAAPRLSEVNRNFPRAYFHLAGVQVLLGKLDEARAAAHTGLALDPGFNLHRYRVNALSDNPVYLAGRGRSCEGMRLAGVPER